MSRNETNTSPVTNEDLTSGFEKKLFQSIPIIEQVMDWYDHVACIFLLYEDPVVAQQQIQSVLTAFEEESNDSWRHLFLPQFQHHTKQDKHTSVLKLIEVLHILQHKKLLNTLEAAVKSTTVVDPFRLKLFYIIDTLSEDYAVELIKCMNSSVVEPSRKNLCLEFYFLEWMINGQISMKDCSRLENSLAHVRNLFDASPSIKSHALLVHSDSVGGSSSKSCRTSLIPSVDSVGGKSSTPYKTELIPSVVPSDLTNLAEEGSSKTTVSHGLCIIINQENFYLDHSLASEILQDAAKEQLKFRHGSHFDRDSLNETFQMLSCDTEIYENLNREKLMSTFSSISQRNFTAYDALVVCILSHGERNSIYTSDCILISLDTIKMYFDGQHCPTLVNKPKLFFLQACQGNTNQTALHDNYEKDGIQNGLPAVSNFFEAWATVPGFFSFRSPFKGSVFIGALCRVFQNYGHKESLLDLMIMVNKEVGKWVGKDFKKQMSCCTYSLLQGVQFQRNEERSLLL